MRRSEGSAIGVGYHSSGGSSQPTHYEVGIQADKRFKSHGIFIAQPLGTITPFDTNESNLPPTHPAATLPNICHLPDCRPEEERSLTQRNCHAAQRKGPGRKGCCGLFRRVILFPYQRSPLSRNPRHLPIGDHVLRSSCNVHAVQALPRRPNRLSESEHCRRQSPSAAGCGCATRVGFRE